jgi:DNA (cytosine-5)-methyltransferase 1
MSLIRRLTDAKRIGPGLIVDLFAGGGGASQGIEAATGRTVDIAINHSPTALAVHQANHPGTVHLTADIWEVEPKDATKGRPVDILWASPDCTHFSVAKGGKPRSQNIRSLAWAVTHWAEQVRPRIIFLENVSEFQGWGPLNEDGKPDKSRMGETFREWKAKLEALGYAVDYRVLDASRFGVPTRRRRLFLVARCDGQPVAWPEPTHGPGGLPLRTAAECIDWSLPCPSIFERKKPLANKTLWRIAQGIRRFVLESPTPYIVGDVAPTMVQTSYGERPGQRPRYLDLHQPLGTVVAQGQKHALVSAFLAKHFGDPLRVQGGGKVLGSVLDAPLGTVTARDHHSLVTAQLGEPAEHVAEVRAFLTAFYNVDTGQALTEPMRTITAKHRLGLVTVEGVDYQIVDIGMRMLEPHELLRAQFGRFANAYDLSAAKSKADKVRLIGNSVCPEVAEAVVRANLRTDAGRRAA